MAVLTVRQLKARDILRLPRVRQRQVDANWPFSEDSHSSTLFEGVRAASPGLIRVSEGAVALVQDELCGYALFRRHDDRFRWDVGMLGAGSPRVDATDEVSGELWAALLEFAIRQAGEQGARRLFATAPDVSVLHDALRQTGFASYTRLFVLEGDSPQPDDAGEVAVRPQHPSDVWSIHQIYSHTTPRPVQYAEALTSDFWKIGTSRIPGQGDTHAGYVADSEEGLGFFCRIETQRKTPLVLSMALGEFERRIVPLTLDSLVAAGLSGSRVKVIVPAYRQEYIREYLERGFWIESERLAMVRHTTVPRIVQPEYQTPVPAAAPGRRRVTGIGGVLQQHSDENELSGRACRFVKRRGVLNKW